MRKWEYKEIYLYYNYQTHEGFWESADGQNGVLKRLETRDRNIEPKKGERWRNSSIDLLNNLGSDGWELILDDGHGRLLFRRSVDPGE